RGFRARIVSSSADQKGRIRDLSRSIVRVLFQVGLGASAGDPFMVRAIP
ncbi:hypothetical protein LINPERHAP1_LOCUS41207, partial [Linum perenne]